MWRNSRNNLLTRTRRNERDQIGGSLELILRPNNNTYHLRQVSLESTEYVNKTRGP